VRPALGTAVFFLVGPVLEAGVGPFLLTGWETGDGALDVGALRVLGGLLLAAGTVVVVHTSAGFARLGQGTPSPAAPPQRLVVTGAYRHVRHPMYVATAVVIAAQGLLLARPVLLVAAAVYLAAMALLATRLEEPRLLARFGAGYETYRRAVPGWLPRPLSRRSPGASRGPAAPPPGP